MMEKDREMEVLKTIGDLSIPAGAIYLSQELQIPQGSMGRILSGLELSLIHILPAYPCFTR